MKIYTSYFGNYRKLAAANVKMICVALGKPRYYNAPQIIEVAVVEKKEPKYEQASLF